MRRRSPSDSRQLLLRAGEKLVRRAPAGPPLDHIKVADVARQAALTHGAIYYHWPTQEAYRADLTAFVLEPGRRRRLAEAWNVAMERAQEGAPFEEVVFAGARHAFEAMRGSPYLAVQLSAWGHREADGRLGELLLALYRRSEDAITSLFRAILLLCHRRLREPYTFDLVAAMMTAALEGLIVRDGIDPEGLAIQGFEDDPSRALGLMLLSLLEMATEPTNS